MHGHSGEPGNEEVDHLAYSGCAFERLDILATPNELHNVTSTCASASILDQNSCPKCQRGDDFYAMIECIKCRMHYSCTNLPAYICYTSSQTAQDNLHAWVV